MRAPTLIRPDFRSIVVFASRLVLNPYTLDATMVHTVHFLKNLPEI
jgi:hypothetical protein